MRDEACGFQGEQRNGSTGVRRCLLKRLRARATTFFSMLAILSSSAPAAGRPSWTYESLGAIWAPPLVLPDGSVMVGAEDSFFYAWAKTGRLLWYYKASEGFSGWPVLVKGKTIAVGNHNGSVYFFDLTGTLVTKTELGGPISGPPAVKGHNLYYATSSGQLVALEGTRLRWSHSTGAPTTSWPALSESGIIYVGCADGSLLALDATGQRLWRTVLGKKAQGSLVALRDRVMAATAEGLIVALDPRGKQLWQYKTPKPPDAGLARLGKGVVFGTAEGLLTHLNGEGKVVWQFSADGPISGLPQVSREGIAFGSAAGSLYLLDHSGQVLDMLPLVSGPISGQVTVTADHYYFGSNDRRLYVLSRRQRQLWSDPASRELKALLERTPRGAVLWRRPLSGAVSRGVTRGPQKTILAATRGKKVFVLDQSGGVKWSYNCGADVETEPAVAPDGGLLFGCDDGGFYGLKPDGELRFRYPVNKQLASSPAVARDGTVYFGAADKRLYALDKTGKMIFRIRTGDEIDSAPRIGPDGVVYVGSDDRHIYSVSPLGHIHWYHLTGGAVRSRPVLAPDGTIYATSFDQQIYALTREGREKWRYQTDGQLLSSPIVGQDGTIFFGSRDHYLYALTSEGKLRWRFRAAGEIDSTPALMPDGAVAFGADDGHLYVLSAEGSLRWWAPAGAEVRGMLIARSDGSLISGTMDGEVLALAPPGKEPAPATRAASSLVQLRWRSRIGRGSVGPTLLLDDGTLVIAGQDGLVRALDERSWPLWTVRVSQTPLSTMVLHESTIFLVDGRGGLAAIRDGQLAFYLRLERSALTAPALLSTSEGTLVIVGAASGRLWAITPDQGKVRWFFSGPAAVSTRPLTLAETAIIVIEHEVIGLDGLGQKQWSMKLPPGRVLDPLRLGQDTVLLGTNQGLLVALDHRGQKRWQKQLGTGIRSLRATPDGSSAFILTESDQLVEISSTGQDLLHFFPPTPIDFFGEPSRDGLVIGDASGRLSWLNRCSGLVQPLLELDAPSRAMSLGPDRKMAIMTRAGEVIMSRQHSAVVKSQKSSPGSSKAPGK